MTQLESTPQKDDLTSSNEEVPQSTNLNSKGSLIQRLRKGHDARTRFVESHVNKSLAFQIRSLRGDLSQEKVMEKLGMNQNAISRLENPYYGKATLTTLKRIAAAYDVGLVVEFVPFSKLANRISGTPYVEHGLTPDSMNVQSFEQEEEESVFENRELGQGMSVTQGVLQITIKTATAGMIPLADFGLGQKTTVRVGQSRQPTLQSWQSEGNEGISGIFWVPASASVRSNIRI